MAHIKKIFKILKSRNKIYRKIAIARALLSDCMKIKRMTLFFIVRPYTMMSYPRLSKLYELANILENENINGSFVECGVWNGGSAGMFSFPAKHNKTRHIWLFDSWKGLPEPTEHDVSHEGLKGEKGMAFGSEEKVKELMYKKLKLNNKNIHLVRGWFENTIPTRKKDIGKIALLHLDCDWYKSIELCLNELYDEVIDGGFVVIDDYGYWGGCKKAVDDFLERRDLKIELLETDYCSVYFQK